MTSTECKTITLRNGYDKKGEMLTFRNPRDVAEMVSYCDSQSHIWFVGLKGDARRAKVNGKVRTWKRDANRVEVPIKYGLYEYGCFEAHDIERILIPVEVHSA